MSRQYFADVISEPIGVAHPTITATTITPLVPVAYLPIPAFDMRPGKIYELQVGGTITTGTAGTLTLTALLNAVSLGAGPAQNYVPSITTAPFLFRGNLICRGPIGLAGATCPVIFNGFWASGGAVATAASETGASVQTSAVNVDYTIAQTLNLSVTVSVAPSIIPMWHVWRSYN